MAYKDFGTNSNRAFQEMQNLGLFQRLHNELKKDFEELYHLTSQAINAGKSSPELIRACVRELFSLIEADLYYLNFINPYPDFHEREGVVEKFKKTYKHHCKVYQLEDTVTALIASNDWKTFLDLKEKRDQLMHPKGRESINVTKDTFIIAYSFFKIYTDFVSKSMTGVGVQYSMSTEDTLKFLNDNKDNIRWK